MGYKAGMTHIVREVEKPGSKLHKKETCEVRRALWQRPAGVFPPFLLASRPRAFNAHSCVWLFQERSLKLHEPDKRRLLWQLHHRLDLSFAAWGLINNEPFCGRR